MPKRVARRSAYRRPVRTARYSGASGTETTRRWWNRATATILTLGALAGAIGAILALRPSPDPEDSARFTAVRVTSQVPLSEYRQRSATMVPQASGHSQGRQHDRGALAPVAELAQASADKRSSPVGPYAAVRHLQPDPTTNSPTDPATDTSAQESPSSDTTASTSTDTSSTDTSSTDTSSTDTSTPGPPTTTGVGARSSSEGFVVPSTFQQEQFSAYAQEVLEFAEAQDSGRKPCEVNSQTNSDDCIKLIPLSGSISKLIPLIGSISLDPKGNPVAPAVAAQRVVELLRDARSTGREPQGGEEPRREPLGVVISADLELAGLRGKPVLLSWSMWQQDGRKRLYGNWLNRNLAYRLEATTDRDTTSLDLWVPLPKSPGPYFIRVNLAAAESLLASADSQPFD
jgi:hypothetical protein